MIGIIWNTALVNPLLNLLVGIYSFTSNLGLSIILMTVLIKVILLPIVLPSMKTMKKQRELAPELKKLKAKYKKDKKRQAQAQMELYKQHGINPSSGCISQIAMLVVLIALYNVIRKLIINADITAINSSLYFDFLKLSVEQAINTKFLHLNLAEKDPFFTVAVLSAGLQFLVGKMTMPYVKDEVKLAKKTPEKSDDMMANMQKQMIYTMPLMNFVIGVTLPSGVMLYILTSTVFQMGQTYFLSGWGGLTPWIKKAKSYIGLADLADLNKLPKLPKESK